MARFDVYRPKRKVARVALLLDLQATSLDGVLDTRVVVPLLPLDRSLVSMMKLNPVLEIAGRSYMASIPEIASISTSELGELVDNAEAHHFEIVQALDFLFQGF